MRNMHCTILSTLIFLFSRIVHSQILQCPTTANECSCSTQSGGSPCTIDCTSTACRNFNLVCRDGDDCTVDCSGNNGCRDAVVTCPQNGDCTVNCNAAPGVCTGVAINIPSAIDFVCNGDCPIGYTPSPTPAPSAAPTSSPTSAPSAPPTNFPTSTPTIAGNNMTHVNVNQDVFSPGMAVGFDAANGTILLFGGGIYQEEGRQLRTFKDFVVEQQSVLNISGWLFAYGQFYTQINDTLWMIQHRQFGGPSLIRFNTVSREVDDPSITIPIGVSLYGCLASMQSANGDEYLFVVGGYDSNKWPFTLNTLQIYEISSGQWMSSPTPPTLQTARGAVACIVHRDILYAIGGWYGGYDGYSLSSIETLSIGSDLADIDSGSAQWSYFEGGELTVSVTGPRAVAYGAFIWIAGGYDAGVERYPTDIHILDTESKSITVDPHNSLVYGTRYPAAIVADRKWFIFGGDDGNEITSKCQYMILSHHPDQTIQPLTTMQPLTTTQTLTTTQALTTTQDLTTMQPVTTKDFAPTMHPLTTMQPVTSIQPAPLTTMQSVTSMQPTPLTTMQSLTSKQSVELTIGLAVGIPLGLLFCICGFCYFCCYRDVKRRDPKNRLEIVSVVRSKQPQHAERESADLIGATDIGGETAAVVTSGAKEWNTHTWMFDNLYFATTYINRYHDLLTQNGFDSKDAISSLTKDDMTRIGIQNSLHQTQIMRAVRNQCL